MSGGADAAFPPAACLWLAALSGGASAIHVAAASDHSEHLSTLAFFAVLAAVQLAWALLVIRRPSRRLLAAGAAINLGVVAIWVVSRTSGIPFDPVSSAPEPVGFKDSVCSALELLLAAGAIGLMLPGAPRLAAALRPPPVALSALSVVVLALAVVAAMSPHHHAMPEQHAAAAGVRAMEMPRAAPIALPLHRLPVLSGGRGS